MEGLGFTFSLRQFVEVAGGQLVLLFAGLVLILLESYFVERMENIKRSKMLGGITIFFILAAIGHITYWQWPLEEVVFMNAFSMEKFTVFASVVVLLSGLLATLLSMGYMENNHLFRGEYFILLMFSLYGAVAMLQSVDLLLMFISLEIMSIAVYVLAAFLKDDRLSQESALKYFFLGSFASAFFLFGLALVFGLTGTVNITEIAASISGGLFHDPVLLVAVALIMAGLFFKMALVPFHMWTPDVYEGSPTMITAYMSTAIKAAAFAVFIKIFAVAFGPSLYESGSQTFSQTINLATLKVYWQPILWWTGLLTMFFGNLFAVAQKNIKRMLAYSSIAHAGYMSLGILAANPEGHMGVLFYLLSYTLMGMGAFGVVYIIDGRERDAQTLDDYMGLGFKYPALSFLMTLFLIAMTGLPPTAGFLSKFYVFSAAIKEGYILLAALGILTSVIAAYYYLRVVYMLYMKEPVREVVPGRVGAPAWLALVFSAIGIIYLGIFPEGIITLAFEAQKSLAFVF